MSLAEPLLRKEDRGNEERLPAEEPPEDAASWVSQLLFWWVGPAIVLPAFRRGHVRLEHLPPSSRVDNPSPLEKAFHNRWTRALEAARAAGASAAAAAAATASATSSSFSSPSLVAVLWRLHWRAFVLSGLLLLLSQICQFGIPYILELFLTELEEPLDGPDSDSLRTSFSLAAALYGASVLRSLLVHQFWFVSLRMGTHTQVEFMGEVYRKALRLSPRARRRYDLGRLTNLMSIDASRVSDTYLGPMLHWGTWSPVLTAAVGIAMLWRLLDWSCLVGIGFIALLVPFGAWAARASKAVTSRLQEKRDARGKAVSETIAGIRTIKVVGWLAGFVRRLQRLRVDEEAALRSTLVYDALNRLVSYFSTITMSALSFAVYTLVLRQSLSAATAFASVSWFDSLNQPLFVFPDTLSSLVTTHVSFTRLREFFAEEEVEAREDLLHADDDGDDDRHGVETSRGRAKLRSDGRGVGVGRGVGRGVGGVDDGNDGDDEDDDEEPMIRFDHATFDWAQGGGLSVPNGDDDGDAEAGSGGHEDEDEDEAGEGEGGEDEDARDEQAPGRRHRRRPRVLRAPGMPTLRDVHFEAKGGLTVVLGPIGSGKSSLLTALTGEIPRTAGQCIVRGSLAYAGQRPWILNRSVRENIVFVSPFDPVWYARVVDACGLGPDIASFPARDDTLIGDQGITLSGGQRQRLALARAVYADTALVALDDVLSAVDATMANHLFVHAIVDLLLRRRKTVLLATHHLRFGLDETHVRHVVVLGADGAVVAQGSPRQVRPIAIRAFSAASFAGSGEGERFGQEEEREEGADPLIAPATAAPVTASDACATAFDASDACATAFDASDASATAFDASGASAAASAVREVSRTTLADRDGLQPRRAEPLPPASATQINEEVAAMGSIRWSHLAAYVASYGSRTYVGCMVFLYVVGTLFSGFVASFWLSRWVSADDPADASSSDAASPTTTSASPTTASATSSGEYSFDQNRAYALVYIAMGATDTVLFMLRYIMTSFGSVVAASALHRRMVRSVLRAPCAFFDETPVGRILNRLMKDQASVDTRVRPSVSAVAQIVVRMVGVFGIVAWTTPYVLGVVAVLIPPYVWLAKRFRVTARDLRRLESTSRSPILAHFAETLRGIPVLRAFRAERAFHARHQALVERNLRTFTHMWAVNQWVTVWLEQLGCLLILAASLFAIYEHERGSLPVALVGFTITYMLELPGLILWLVRNFTQAETDLVAVERVTEYIDLAPEGSRRARLVESDASPPPEDTSDATARGPGGAVSADRSRDATTASPRSRVPPAIPFVFIPAVWPPVALSDPAPVAIDHLWFRYKPSLPWVLRDVSLHIPAGAKVALVGRTGSGKSTLAGALLRLYPYWGSVAVHGLELQSLSVARARRLSSAMLQDGALFAGTIRDNLLGFADGPDHVESGSARERRRGVRANAHEDDDRDEDDDVDDSDVDERRDGRGGGPGAARSGPRGKRVRLSERRVRGWADRAPSRTGLATRGGSSTSLPMAAAASVDGGPGSTASRASDAACWAALRRVGLDRSIQSLDIVVEDHGSNLSVGEKQLLCLARSLLRPAGLFLFDEATASVDEESDQIVHDTVLSLPATVISICHRLQHVPRFDLAVVLRDGRVLEAGSPATLLADPTSALASLARHAGLAGV